MNATTVGTLDPMPPLAFRPRLQSVPAGRHRVSRTGLVNRLRGCSRTPVVQIVAPAGYGKSTVLAQWAERESRPCAIVSIGGRHECPDDLLTDIRAAVEHLEVTSWAPDVPSLWAADVPRQPRSLESNADQFGQALSSLASPVCLVLDNAHLLKNPDCRHVLEPLITNLSAGSMIVLAGRAPTPAVPIGRLRSEERVLEIGTDDLRFSPSEGRALLDAAGVVLDRSEMTALMEQTEGWATGLSLAALALTSQSRPAEDPRTITGDDRFVVDYLRAELIPQLTSAELRFLTRSAVLDRMSGPLCDAALDSCGSRRMLDALDEASMFLVPLDHQRRWFRHHRLFREFLHAELDRREPEIVPELNRNAAAWAEANGAVEDAVRYAQRANDAPSVGRLVGGLAVPLVESGRISVLLDWTHWVDENGSLESFPDVATTGALAHLVAGDAVNAARFLAEGERTPANAEAALVRAATCAGGIEKMRSDAQLAVDELPVWSPWQPAALLCLGASLFLHGDSNGADAVLGDSVERAAPVSATHTMVTATVLRSLIAIERNAWGEAQSLAHRARELLTELEETGTSAIVYAACARVAVHARAFAQATQDLASAARVLPRLTYALPWLAVHARLELARAHLALTDLTAARTMLSEADEVLRRRPGVGVLADDTRQLRERIDSHGELESTTAHSLTRAELRLLPLLSTHLTFREIAAQKFLSRTTIKTQSISIYRKLGVSSRSEAVERAAACGLLVEAAAVPPSAR